MAQIWIFSGSQIEQAGPHPSKMSRGRWPCGRPPPVKRKPRSLKIFIYVCVFSGPFDIKSDLTQESFTVLNCSLDGATSACRSGDQSVGPSYRLLRNSASGPEIGLSGRISAGFQSGRPQNQPSGRPKVGRRTDLEAFPIRIRPKSCPEN